VGRKRIARLMKAADIVGCHRRKRSYSITRQDPTAEAAPDLVDRKFVSTEPNQLWVADVTYVPTVQGWLYLACVTDVFSRMVLGWSMASHRKTDLVIDAVTMAVSRRGGQVPGVIHHSDRGGEYTSHALERELRRQVRWPAWDRSRTSSITPWPRASSRPWSASCSTSSPAAGSRPDVRPSSRAVFDYLEGLSTRAGSTPHSVTSARRWTKS